MANFVSTSAKIFWNTHIIRCVLTSYISKSIRIIVKENFFTNKCEVATTKNKKQKKNFVYVNA